MPSMRFQWIARDAKLVITSRAIHTFGQGVLAVTLGVYLSKIGLSPVQVGLFFSLGFAGTAVLSVISALVSERVGRRGLLVGYTGFIAIGGVALVITNHPYALWHSHSSVHLTALLATSDRHSHLSKQHWQA